MSITKTASGWLVDIQPGGRGGKRFRKTLDTKAEALAYEAFVRTKVTKTPEWVPQKRDLRRLSELISIWYENHGRQLRSGKDTNARLKAACEAMGNPLADQFNAGMFAEYRSRRLADGVTANCMNREHAYMRAVFNELRRLKIWKGENPLGNLRQFKIAERELSFLSLDEIQILLDSLTEDVLMVAKICLATGARWSEAEQLKTSQVKNGQIQFSGTKSGKNRSVPIDDDLMAKLDEFSKRSYTGRLFKGCYETFKRIAPSTGLALPKGQLTHVLRHTFASHFMMNGGNILALQRILGHANLTMTMRYAHLAPEHLQEARTLNPLSRLTVR